MYSSESFVYRFHFNPRIRVGCDYDPGAAVQSSEDFNPRIRVGCDLRLPLCGGAVKFQSTHPRGMRLKTSITNEGRDYFNPRIRVGCDLQVLESERLSAISIHASAWDATGYESYAGWSVEISIHASAWDATPLTMQFRIWKAFQSTHPRGMRPSLALQCQNHSHFNPRIRVGCD